MKYLLTTVFAVAVLAIPAFAEEETPLGKEMEKVSKAIKAVNRTLADPAQKDANLAKLADVKAGFEKALTLEPEKAKDVPAGEKAKFLADYKASMEEALKTLEELRAAVAADKADDAAKAMEKLNKGKKEAHKQFKKED